MIRVLLAKTNFRFLMAWQALGLLASAGCTGPKVLTDFDRSADFSALHTFAFAGLAERAP